MLLKIGQFKSFKPFNSFKRCETVFH